MVLGLTKDIESVGWLVGFLHECLLVNGCWIHNNAVPLVSVSSAA